MAIALQTIEQTVNPVDHAEQVATSRGWSYERNGENEINISVSGSWTDYHVSMSWQDDLESLHIASVFDFRVPARRQDEIHRLICRINEQLWLGHFDIWTQEGAAMFRHGQLYAGGAEPTAEQCEALLYTAVETCERYYQSFQFVLWAGKSAAQALETSLFETVGRA